MRKIDEILSNPDIGTRIELLKKHRGRYVAPDTASNLKDWEPMKHDIMDKEKYKDEDLLVEKGKKVYDPVTKTTKVLDDKYEKVEVNRTPLGIEQDIVNIHTAFCVGLEPNIICDDDNDSKLLVSALRYTFKKNFIKYVNRQEVRSWLSEQEVAEYWYADTDTDGFWSKILRKISSAVGKTPIKRPRCVVWSPFRGDELIPFMEDGKMTGFIRGYNVTDDKGHSQRRYMCITDSHVYTWVLADGSWQEDPKNTFRHGFSKIPVDYMWRPTVLTKNISPIRARLEKTLSQYGDCVDYHFFPYLIHFGEAENVQGKKRNHIIEITGRDGKAPMYLTWNQVPDTVKFEVETNLDLAYSLTNTPRISFERLKGMGVVSGEAFKFYFMGAIMAAENHYEELGPFLQRRVNLVTSMLGDMNSNLFKASRSIDIECSPKPYMLDDIGEKISNAVKATGGAIWSKKSGIAFVGNIDHADEEYKKMIEETKEMQKSESE